MRQFMSTIKIPASVNSDKKPATECSSCASTGVKEASEDILAVTAKENENRTDQQEEKSETVVMSGPLGAAVTEALNKKYKKTVAGLNVANEDANLVTASGQIYKPDEFVSRMRKSVGLVPRTDDCYSTVNVMLDAASKVDEVDFVVVNSVEAPLASNAVPTKSILYSTKNGNVGLECFAVESVEITVKVRKIK